MSDTGSDTVSTHGDPDYSDPALQGLSPAQIEAHLFLAISTPQGQLPQDFPKARSQNAQISLKWTGKGKGKGANRFGFLAAMSDQEYSELFYGGRQFVRRISGGGKGRKKNPRNRNGEIMTCGECGADDHVCAQCPWRGQQQRAMFTTSAPTPVPSELGPVGDLFLYATDAPASSPDSIQSNATTIPAELVAPVP